MAKIVGLPKLSPTMDEGTLVKWNKQEGESVEIDDLLAEVETDKATMEFRSFDKGILLKQLAPEGATLAPDAPVAIIGKKGEDIAALVKEASAALPSTASDSTASTEDATPAVTKADAPPAPVIPQTSSLPTPTLQLPAPTSTGRALASPLVRRLALERNIDLSKLSGTGPRGRIIKKDLENYRGGGASSLLKLPPLQAKQDPLSSMRKTIAKRLTESKQQIPHFYLTIDIDADPLWQARIKINKELESQGGKVSVNDLVIKGCALALRKLPEANASFSPDGIIYHGRVDISVAVAVPEGLVTPVVRGADAKNVLEISNEVKDLAGRAKSKKLSLEEMQNGTFSVSNLGMFGIESFSAVINPPEGAIIAVGAVRQEAVVKDGEVIPGRRMRMTLSCDHRVIDGAVGARFLAELRGFLESPLTMFM